MSLFCDTYLDRFYQVIVCTIICLLMFVLLCISEYVLCVSEIGWHYEVAPWLSLNECQKFSLAR